MKKAAGYIRVSSKDQVSGESLTTQRQNIKGLAKHKGYELTKIYADEGISGGTIEKRHALLQCMQDGQNGKFNVLIIHRLSRFGRNARELLNNYEELKKNDIDLYSISENIDFGTKYGKAMMGMFAIMAELERDIIREQMLENRIARSKRGIPASGSLPTGRTYDRKNNEWQLDNHMANLLQRAAKQYIEGVPLIKIHEETKKLGLKLNKTNLLETIKNKCGDTWTVNFKDQEPITYEIPRILDEETINKVHSIAAINRRFNRSDKAQSYLLKGFIRCYKCQSMLTGMSSAAKQKAKKYSYYRHPVNTHRRDNCDKKNLSLPVALIERAVFETIFENIVDVPRFEAAIADSLPDENKIKTLKALIEAKQKELTKTAKDLEKLVDMALAGTLTNETIKQKETHLLTTRKALTEELQQARTQYKNMPDINEVKTQAREIRMTLLQKYSSKEHFENMTIEEKRQLLLWLFSGIDKKGTPYGIYIDKKGSGKNVTFDYFLYGRITGLRTIKGDDINYFEQSSINEDNTINTTNPNAL